MRCIVHIGTHKTGSTALQQALAAYDGADFRYPLIGGHRHHNRLLGVFDPKLEAENARQRRRKGKPAEPLGRDELARRLEAAIAACESDTVVLSSEGFYRLGETGLAALRAFLDRRFADFRLIGYVRAPGAFVSTMVQEVIKSSANAAFAPEIFTPRYRAMFQPIDDVFGRERVRLYKYDPAAFPNRDIVSHFAVEAGLPPLGGAALPANVSFGRDAARAFYTYNLYARRRGLAPAEAQRNKTRMRGAFRALEGGPFRLSAPLLAPILAEIEPEIAWMEARLGARLREERTPDGAGIGGEADLLPPAPDLEEKLAALLGGAGPATSGRGALDDIGRLAEAVAAAGRGGRARAGEGASGR